MLKGNFYTIKESSGEGNTFKMKIQFNAAHDIFKGHFPDLPVVPGVCQTQMLVEALEYLLQRPVHMKVASHIKFLALLNPVKDNLLDMEIKIEKQDGDSLWVSAAYSSPAEVFFRFKGEFVNG
jgi:3-hydroxyacyl-[acyl-carrier-protein] dehydratase